MRASLVLGAFLAISTSTSTAAAIVGGAPNTTEPGVVQVLIQHETDPTEETSFQCTGTVVSPHVVLTAAHCLHASLVGEGQSYFVFFGDDSDSPSQTADQRNFGYAKNVIVHPDFDPETTLPAKDDLGVVVLLDPAPTTPRKLQRAKLDETAIGRELVVFGYGQTKAGAVHTSGRRTEMRTPVTRLTDVHLVTKPRGTSFCEGDSGGPSFLDGRLAGVHSSVEIPSRCGGENYDTRVDAHLAWIDAQIQAADPGFVSEPEEEPAPAPPEPPAPATTTTTEGCASSSGSTSSWPLVVLAFVALRGRRRRVTPPGA